MEFDEESLEARCATPLFVGLAVFSSQSVGCLLLVARVDAELHNLRRFHLRHKNVAIIAERNSVCIFKALKQIGQ